MKLHGYITAWAVGLALLVAAAGCGGKQKAKNGDHALDTDKVVDRRVECNAGDMGSCITLARANCLERAWSLEYDDSPAMYVSESGLVRVDRQGMLLFSTNTAEWLACLEKCPGTDATNVCLPFGHTMEFATAPIVSCKKTDREIHPWNGHPAKALQVDCPDGVWEITYVPAFLEVHKALVAAGAIKSEDVLATVGGLVVKASFSGYPLLTLSAVSNAHCSLFDLPKDYEVVTGRLAFDELREMQSDLEARLDAALTALQEGEDNPAKKARKEVEPQLKELCSKAGYATNTEAELDTCVNEVMSARALVAKVTTRALDRFAKEAEPKLQEILNNEYIAPLCQHYKKD